MQRIRHVGRSHSVSATVQSVLNVMSLLDHALMLQAAVDMMRKVLNTVNMDGTIVIGEGEKDEVRLLYGQQRSSDVGLNCKSFGLQAPMLYCGEQIGNGTLEPQVDIAVDPLDGTTSIALVCFYPQHDPTGISVQF